MAVVAPARRGLDEPRGGWKRGKAGRKGRNPSEIKTLKDMKMRRRGGNGGLRAKQRES